MQVNWQAGRLDPHLDVGEAHVWRLKVSGADSPILSPDEQVRADRFALPQHRLAFAARRTWLRRLLAHYLGCGPLEIEFTYGPDGKPEISSDLVRGIPLRFSSSHSGDWLLIAVTLETDIGVDIERIDAQRDYESIAAESLSSGELAAFKVLAEDEKPSVFVKVWTQKEAFVKAIGKGITYPLRNVEVSLGLETSGGLIGLGDGTGNVSEWTLTSFEPAESHHAAIAIARPGAFVSYFYGPERSSGLSGAARDFDSF
jgi:4'-phosphopantetheinyl transferase